MGIEAADALMGIFGFKRIEGQQMKTVEETRRELFEPWASDGGKWPKAVERTADNQYQLMRTHSDWLAFNAALDAVVIRLPCERHIRSRWPEGCGVDMAFNDCRQLCADAIESTNLGLTIK